MDIFVKIVIFVCNEKEAGDGPFFKKYLSLDFHVVGGFLQLKVPLAFGNFGVVQKSENVSTLLFCKTIYPFLLTGQNYTTQNFTKYI